MPRHARIILTLTGGLGAAITAGDDSAFKIPDFENVFWGSVPNSSKETPFFFKSFDCGAGGAVFCFVLL
jgi:hypothetical protein